MEKSGLKMIWCKYLKLSFVRSFSTFRNNKSCVAVRTNALFATTVFQKSIKCLNQPAKRFFYTNLLKKPSIPGLKKNDGIPQNYLMIYKLGFDRYLIGCQLCLCLSIAFLTVYVVINSDVEEYTSSFTQMRTPVRRTENEKYVYFTVFVIFLTSLNILLSRLPVRIYRRPKTGEYTIVTYGMLPRSKKYLHCKPGQVVKLEESGILPWKDSRYNVIIGVRESTVILLDYYFRRPADLNIMLGFQRDDIEEEEEQ